MSFSLDDWADKEALTHTKLNTINEDIENEINGALDDTNLSTPYTTGVLHLGSQDTLAASTTYNIDSEAPPTKPILPLKMVVSVVTLGAGQVDVSLQHGASATEVITGTTLSVTSSGVTTISTFDVASVPADDNLNLKLVTNAAWSGSGVKVDLWYKSLIRS